MATPDPQPSSPPTVFPISSPSPSATTQSQPETLEHLLSLPPLLLPISPPLAALHLARVRLAFSIPTSRRSGGLTELWCHSCGGLREGLGGATRGKFKGKKRVRDHVESDKSVEDGEAEIASTLVVERVSSSPQPSPCTERNRKKPNCAHCGASYSRPKPDLTTLAQFLPARTASRTIKTRGMDTLITPVASRSTESTLNPAVSRTTEGEVELSPSDGSTIPRAVSDPALDTAQQANKRPPNLLSTPRLSYLPYIEPNPPTYPKPPGRSSPPPSNQKGAKRKKRPASGLAKLLAESKERDSSGRAGVLSGGSWGLS